ncbi:hypothetical protein O2N63_03185 [Aliiroseovarius sp. KMU-50]|uniref:Uncharacterized protein n=1 Tax=Aliiroseovarius salicola TaxID=3009082 RepID=A0ABT4VXW3_9RHOB|nr:hypothetical protein [Aliiroseovarius sp. KMU-50]MDA5093082.1 hypothetical protein [Aliiroseovarius sp. KMU-50]
MDPKQVTPANRRINRFLALPCSIPVHAGKGSAQQGNDNSMLHGGDAMTFIWIGRAIFACLLKNCAALKVSQTLAICAAVIFTGADPSIALTPRTPKPGATIVIGNDYGGSVRERHNEIQRINALGQRVEIRGQICLSSCTMFLGAKNVCVSSRTTFGFHGPHRFGSRLSPEEFDQWSKVIAAYYPASVKSWYLQKARHQIYKIARLKGSELVRLGVTKCQ